MRISNDETRMTNKIRSSNAECRRRATRERTVIRISGFGLCSSFVIRISLLSPGWTALISFPRIIE